jgi:hypothetical protein
VCMRVREPRMHYIVGGSAPEAAVCMRPGCMHGINRESCHFLAAKTSGFTTSQ